MAAESTIRDLFRSLEQTIKERLHTIEDVMRLGRGGDSRGGDSRGGDCKVEEKVDIRGYIETPLDERIERLEIVHHKWTTPTLEELIQKVAKLEAQIEEMNKKTAKVSTILPVHPLDGIEVIPKREVVIQESPKMQSISTADRLLLNKKARKALEAEEMGEGMEEHPQMDDNEIIETLEKNGESVEEVVEEEVVEEEVVEEEVVEEEVVEEEVVEEEVVEEEEADEEAEVQLEEFEYKGATYYRDAENNVFMTDEEGELVEDAIGIWNPTKQKIVMRKP